MRPPRDPPPPGGAGTAEDACAQLAASVPCVVASVEYRLAPEHKFPAAPRDCMDALRFFADGGGEAKALRARFSADVTRIAVAGDSAGGNLAVRCPPPLVSPLAELVLGCVGSRDSSLRLFVNMPACCAIGYSGQQWRGIPHAA